MNHTFCILTLIKDSKIHNFDTNFKSKENIAGVKIFPMNVCLNFYLGQV